LLRTVLRQFWWPLTVAAALVLGGVTVAKGYANLSAAQEELDQVRASTMRLEKENRALYRTVLRLRGDPQAMERACRRDMGVVRPDEVVYQDPGDGVAPLAKAGEGQ
jgi:cell division protein FtsB